MHDLEVVFRCHCGSKASLQSARAAGITIFYLEMWIHWMKISTNKKGIITSAGKEGAWCWKSACVILKGVQNNSLPLSISSLIIMPALSCFRHVNIYFCQPCIRGTHLCGGLKSIYIHGPIKKTHQSKTQLFFLGFYLWVCVMNVNSLNRDRSLHDWIISTICWSC